ncbi:MAG: uncharacterized protein QOF76_527, partial [Solirubrobacteraceae bacterium]|nr:uncharacterized protein [Solirubrobacteraceae bacterium]
AKPLNTLTKDLPFHDAVDDSTAFLDPDNGDNSGPGGFASTVNDTAGVPPVTPAAFPPTAIGGAPAAKREVKKILVTGDSMTQPMDAIIGRRLADTGITVDRDVHIGTGISSTTLLDWGRLSTKQAGKNFDAVVIFIGANDGFDIGKIKCCSAEWAAAYATRVRTMMNTYRRDGATNVYWITLPLPRDNKRAAISRTVNGSVRAAAAAYARDVHIVDFTALFTPGNTFRESMSVGGRDELVRLPDGIHLNETGGEVAADAIMARMAQDYSNMPSR